MPCGGLACVLPTWPPWPACTGTPGHTRAPLATGTAALSASVRAWRGRTLPALPTNVRRWGRRPAVLPRAASPRLGRRQRRPCQRCSTERLECAGGEEEPRHPRTHRKLAGGGGWRASLAYAHPDAPGSGGVSVCGGAAGACREHPAVQGVWGSLGRRGGAQLCTAASWRVGPSGVRARGRCPAPRRGCGVARRRRPHSAKGRTAAKLPGSLVSAVGSASVS